MCFHGGEPEWIVLFYCEDSWVKIFKRIQLTYRSNVLDTSVVLLWRRVCKVFQKTSIGRARVKVPVGEFDFHCYEFYILYKCSNPLYKNQQKPLYKILNQKLIYKIPTKAPLQNSKSKAHLQNSNKGSYTKSRILYKIPNRHIHYYWYD